MYFSDKDVISLGKDFLIMSHSTACTVAVCDTLAYLTEFRDLSFVKLRAQGSKSPVDTSRKRELDRQ